MLWAESISLTFVRWPVSGCAHLKRWTTPLANKTLLRMRKTLASPLTIRLKTVIMKQNLADVCNVACFAQRHGLEVFYQPIEQNYNTVENPSWFEERETWPDDIPSAIAVVRELKQLKSDGLPIVNSRDQLGAMIPYFENPAAHRVAVQAHAAHEKKLSCSALTMLQIQANGDVTTCSSMPSIGSIRNGRFAKSGADVHGGGSQVAACLAKKN